MAFTQPEVVAIRHYMGSSALNKGFYPLLESAIVTVQSQADGGSQVDNSTELAIRALLTQFAAVETQLQTSWVAAIAVQADEAKIDAARGVAMLRMEGRRLSGALARYLGFKAALSDIWNPAQPHVPPLVGPDLFETY